MFEDEYLPLIAPLDTSWYLLSYNVYNLGVGLLELQPLFILTFLWQDDEWWRYRVTKTVNSHRCTLALLAAQLDVVLSKIYRARLIVCNQRELHTRADARICQR